MPAYSSKPAMIRQLLPLLLAACLVVTQLLSVLHQHQPLDTPDGEICLKCLVLQQGSSALSAPLFSFHQPVVWLVVPLVALSGKVSETQIFTPIARGPPSDS